MKNKVISKKVALLSSLLVFSAIPISIVSCEVKNTTSSGVTPPKEKPASTLDDILMQVVVDVDNKENIEAEKVTKEMVTFKNYDTEKFEVNIVQLIPSNLRQILLVKIKIVDKNTKEQSAERTVELASFKKFVVTKELLNEEVKKIKYDYNSKDTTVAWEAEELNVMFSEFDTELYETKIEGIDLNADNKTLDLNFYLKDKISDTKSDTQKVNITGFKVVEPETSSLSKLFWRDTNGILEIPKDKKQALVDALNKKESVFMVNLTEKKFVTATGKEQIDFSKAETFVELGKVNEDFLKKQIEEFEKFMVQAFGNIVYPRFKSFLSSSKEEKLKTFSDIKLVLSITASLVKDKIKFQEDWIQTLERILKYDDQIIVLNVKTGEFVTTINETTEINLEDATSFKVIATVEKKFLGQMHQELIDQLTMFKIDENAFDNLFTTENTPYFMLEVKNGNLTTSVGLNHKRTEKASE